MTQAPGRFWQLARDGVSVAVAVQPRSRRPGIQGWAEAGARLRIGVAEPAEDGRATAAACAVLARALDLPPRAVTLLAGAARRQKTLKVAGEAALLAPRLAALEKMVA